MRRAARSMCRAALCVVACVWPTPQNHATLCCGMLFFQPDFAIILFLQRRVRANVAAARLATKKHSQESARIAAAHPIIFSPCPQHDDDDSKKKNMAAAAVHTTQDTHIAGKIAASSCKCAVASSTRYIRALSLEASAAASDHGRADDDDVHAGMCPSSGTTKDVPLTHAHCIFERDLCMDAVEIEEASLVMVRGSDNNKAERHPEPAHENTHPTNVYQIASAMGNSMHQVSGASVANENFELNFSMRHSALTDKEQMRAAHMNTSLKELLGISDTSRLVAA
jgi:hypothetical protein